MLPALAAVWPVTAGSEFVCVHVRACARVCVCVCVCVYSLLPSLRDVSMLALLHDNAL